MHTSMYVALIVLTIGSFLDVTNQQCIYTDVCFSIYDRGSSYRGKVNQTKSGVPCLNWNGHPFDVSPVNYPDEGLNDNYCRNPRGSGNGPWCYTGTNSSLSDFYGFCDIPKCDKCLFNGLHMKEGDSFHDGCAECSCTPYGIRCFTCQTSPTENPKMGCYPKEDKTARFPNCCKRLICHDTDPNEFNFQEYIEYMKKALGN